MSLISVGPPAAVESAPARPAFGRAQAASEETAIDVEIRGGRLHVVSLGPRDAAGPAILLLHGASGNHRDLRFSIGERLALRNRVILVDRPGHGDSDRLGGREMASPARQGDAIAEALGRLSIGRVVAVGHSWSGALAASLALDHSRLVAGLVVLSGATGSYPTDADWYNRIAATPLLGDLFAATLVGPVGRLKFPGGVRSIFRPHRPPPDYIGRTRAELLLRPAEFKANAEDLVDLRAFLRAQAARNGDIRVPTTIVTADRDDIVSPELHARKLHAQARGSELVVLDGAGHMPHWTATDRVVAEIEAVASKARRSAQGVATAGQAAGEPL